MSLPLGEMMRFQSEKSIFLTAAISPVVVVVSDEILRLWQHCIHNNVTIPWRARFLYWLRASVNYEICENLPQNGVHQKAGDHRLGAREIGQQSEHPEGTSTMRY
jgi:hypothetical protein